MKALVNSSALLTITLLVTSAQAQTSYELTCRAKAKELAAQTYTACITDSRSAQVDQIRKDYQRQLAELKAKYDKELKKVSGKGVSGTAKSPQISASTGSLPKAANGMAKSLPMRKESKSQAAVIQEVGEDKAVVTPEANAPGVDDEASQNDARGDLKIHLVPASGSEDKTAASFEEQEY
ncbi:MAG: hypothetical protein IPM97_04985 [Bdellovibrionaceae bacterium]|nr:hypothetical protein [Pseudobdellovibrionaceae bacterium]